MHNRREAKPTYVARVEVALKEGDDFLTVEDVKARTKLDGKHVLESLHHLYRHKAAVMLSDCGVTYWYSTADQDTRTKVIPERKLEEPGSRGGKRKKGLPAALPALPNLDLP